MVSISPGGFIKIKITHYILVWLRKLAVAPVLWYRRARYGYPFRRIRLAGPRYVKVDAEDYECLKPYEWFLFGGKSNFYVKRVIRKGRYGQWRVVSMHREIVKARKGMLVDHKNHDTVDNRKGNLREATHGQNMANRVKSRTATSSQYKGVSRRKDSRKWVAQIEYKGKKTHLGCFDDEAEAAKAYDKAAKERHGEFAWLNFPEP